MIKIPAKVFPETFDNVYRMERFLNLSIVISICIIVYAVFVTPKNPEPVSVASSTVFEKLPEPSQSPYNGGIHIPIKSNDLDITIYPQANYRIYAMVMSKRKYNWGWESQISPYDLALAWNKLMLPEYQKGIRYSQSGRWYHYVYSCEFPLPKSYIISHSSNHHIIPANENVKKALDKVKKRQKIYLEGYLVNIKGKFQGREVWWNSSMTRNDSGNGACEVLYLTKAVMGNEVFE